MAEVIAMAAPRLSTVEMLQAAEIVLDGAVLGLNCCRNDRMHPCTLLPAYHR
jgi:hypothetical protein